MRRLLWAALMLVVAAGGFAWGLATGVYHIFPWDLAHPLAHRARSVLDAAGILQTVETVYSGLLNFELTVINDGAPIEGDGGGLALTPEGLLVGRSTNRAVQFYDFATGSMTTLAFRLPPTNRDRLPPKTPGGRSVDPTTVRYQDVEVLHRPDGDHLLVTHAYFDTEQQCFTTLLEEAPLPDGWTRPAGVGEAAAELTWRLLLEGTPCLPLAEERNAFGGTQAGGRIAIGPDGAIFVTTGDLEFDGTDSKSPGVSQLEGSTYGRVFRIDFDSSASEQISMGHRNPQGLTFDAAGQLWMAEQGPQGGDELNLIQPGTNYGWPSVTLGVFYGDKQSDAKYWPLSIEQGRHSGYTLPRFAWNPSIAPSSIKLIEGLDPRWDGDLLISTLINESLHRVRLDGDHVLFDERIDLGRRIRDIEIANGRIYMLFDSGRFGYLEPHKMGEAGDWAGIRQATLTSDRCMECHSNPALPRLRGLFGASIAAQPDIHYSDALKAVGGTWTREALTQFLSDPSAFAPGTEMPSPGLAPDEIGKLVDELEALRP